MKKLLLILFLFSRIHTQAQSQRYTAWKSDSTRRHDSTFHRYDTAFARLRYGFRMSLENWRNAKTHVDSVYWMKIHERFLQELLPLERKHDDENYHFGQKHFYKP